MEAIIKIFIEGKSDKKFIEDYLKFIFNEPLNKTIRVENLNGKDSVKKARPNFHTNTVLGGLNLIIFDADTSINDRRRYLLNLQDELNIEFELFLLPNDNDSGELEDLLRKLTIDEHEGIFECFNAFNQCLSQKNDDYDVPNLNLQLFSYLSFQKKESKEAKRDYLDTSVWDLNNVYLKPLKEFLVENINAFNNEKGF